MGPAAELGAVRFEVAGRKVILLHAGLTVEEQTAHLTELLRDGEVAVYTFVLPQQRSAPAVESAKRVG